MREATSCGRSFSVWDTVRDRFVEMRGEQSWDGEQEFRDALNVAAETGDQSACDALRDWERVVSLLPKWARAT